MSFDWRTDEDNEWHDEKPLSKPATTQSKWQSRWPFLLFVLAGLVAAWFLVRWQVDQRVASATVEVEADLLATHNFVLQTAVSQDEDLFRPNLSGRDEGWAEAQKEMLTEGLLLGRPMFGWQQIDDLPLAASDVSLTVSPDLRAAELLFPQTYAITVTEGVTETITLQQTAVYRLGKTRWLYAPPEEEFWGDWITSSGGRVTLVYPQRDAAVAERLAADLDVLVGQMCREFAALDCTDDLRLHVRLDKEPDALIAANEIENILKSGLRLNLPTPTLVGLPMDEAGYELLYRGYATQVVTAALAHLTEYDCCTNQLFLRALRDYHLAELGLQPWPLAQADFDHLIDGNFDGDVVAFWSRRWETSKNQQRWVYALVDYLAREEAAVSVTEMIVLMNDRTYFEWLDAVLQGSYDETLFAAGILQYIYDNSTSGQLAQPPIPLPEQTLKLVCGGFGSSGASAIYEYDWAQRAWSQEFINNLDSFTINDSDFIQLSPSGEEAILTVHDFEGSVTQLQTFLIVDGELQLLEEKEYDNNDQSAVWISYGFSDPQGNYIARYEYLEDRTITSLFERDCLEEGCPRLDLPSWPIWSPGGEHLLVSEFIGPNVRTFPNLGEANLYLYDLSGEVTDLGKGIRPFWLNDERYGYFEIADESMRMFTAVLGENKPRYVLETSILLAELDDDADIDNLVIGFAVPNPQNARELLLVAYAGNPAEGSTPREEAAVFLIELEDDFVTVANIESLSTPEQVNYASFSPDGRYILNFTYPVNSQGTTVTFMDRQTNEQILVESDSFSPAWTADGRWLALARDNYVLLQAPAHDNYQLLIPHGLQSCGQVAWAQEH